LQIVEFSARLAGHHAAKKRNRAGEIWRHVEEKPRLAEGSFSSGL
jgi:hypothetical protein